MNVYEIITKEIMDKLEAGEIPWHKPWIGDGQPKNLVSKKAYRGINTFLLGCSKYSSPYWVSFKQCSEMGGTIRKGEKSTMVVFWKPLKFTDKGAQEGEVSEKTISFLRYYRVFNVEQCDGLDKKIPHADNERDFQPIAECERIIDGMPNKPDIKHGESRAYYHTGMDYVNMPKKEAFEDDEYYYSVLFHELGHSTGHQSRLDRKTVTDATHFGSESYSKEELVAEMTAAFLCGISEIENVTIDNSAAYIKGWLKKLKDDPKCVILAAAQAQRAADYILDKQYNNKF